MAIQFSTIQVEQLLTFLLTCVVIRMTMIGLSRKMQQTVLKHQLQSTWLHEKSQRNKIKEHQEGEGWNQDIYYLSERFYRRSLETDFD